MLHTRSVVLLFGKICSGKSSFADALSYVTKAERITVSDIVKRVSGAQSRAGLQNTKDLDQAIAHELIQEINRVLKYGKVIVDGIRQQSIVDRVVKEFKPINIEGIWLEVPDDTRKHRFYDRVGRMDDISFEDADQRDAQLGLEELYKQCKPWLTVVNN